MSVKVLLTGKPGIGKTTVVKKVVRELGGYGFYTEEWREKGRRKGFYLVLLHGGKFVLAEKEKESPFRVGRYAVFPEVMEEAVREIEEGIRKGKIIVMDEIGKMELFSREFREMVRKVFSHDVSVLATVPVSRIPLVEEIKRRKDIKLFEVTVYNRDELPEKIMKIFLERC